MQTLSFDVCSDPWRPAVLTTHNGWIAVALAHEQDLTSIFPIGGRFRVALAHLASGDGSPLSIVLDTEDREMVMASKFADILTVCVPTALAISDEDVLAMALGAGGVVLWSIHTDLPTNKHCVQRLAKVEMRRDCVEGLRWIAPAVQERSLALWTQGPTGDSVKLCSEVPLRTEWTAMQESGSCDRVVLKDPVPIMSTKVRSIQAFDATRSGVVVVAYHDKDRTHFLNVMTRGVDGMFDVQTLDLNFRDQVERPVVTAVASLAVSDRMIVVGYSCYDPKHKAVGMVEAFDPKSGAMETRRLLFDKAPTAVATSGQRILIGTTLLPMHEPRLHVGVASLYGLTVKNSTTFTICPGDVVYPHWPRNTVFVDRQSWVYARCVSDGRGGAKTVIEKALVLTSAGGEAETVPR